MVSISSSAPLTTYNTVFLLVPTFLISSLLRWYSFFCWTWNCFISLSWCFSICWIFFFSDWSACFFYITRGEQKGKEILINEAVKLWDEADNAANIRSYWFHASSARHGNQRKSRYSFLWEATDIRSHRFQRVYFYIFCWASISISSQMVYQVTHSSILVEQVDH